VKSRRGGINADQKLAIADVREIYAELATRPITRQCTLRTECCQFLLTGKTPYLTKGEALVAARALKATGRRSLPKRDDGACPLLDPTSARCLIYDSRPFGCRTHFCAAAGGPFPRKDVADLIHRLEAIGLQLGDSEARPLAPAVEQALEES
jgi:Fe-S-cluster containining protein